VAKVNRRGWDPKQRREENVPAPKMGGFSYFYTGSNRTKTYLQQRWEYIAISTLEVIAQAPLHTVSA